MNLRIVIIIVRCAKYAFTCIPWPWHLPRYCRNFDNILAETGSDNASIVGQDL